MNQIPSPPPITQNIIRQERLDDGWKLDLTCGHEVVDHMPWSIGQSILCQQCQNDWLRCQPRPIDIIASEDSLKHFILQECLETMRRPEIQALIAESGYDLEVIGTLFQRGSNAVCKFFNVPAVQFDITSVSQQILEQLKK